MKNKKILIVEDQPDISSQLTSHLESLGAHVIHLNDARQTLGTLRKTPCDILIFDTRATGINGLELCRTLRHGANYIPLILVSPNTSEVDRILGLEAGADDYISRPFHILELIARTRALLRRMDAVCPGKAVKSTIRIGDISIDSSRHEVYIKQQRVELTAREFTLLEHFSLHPGQVFTRNELLNKVWGYSFEGYEHTVNSHINRLRAKLADIGEETYISTVWGVGYKLEVPNEEMSGINTRMPA